MKRLRVRHGRVTIVAPGSAGWLVAGLALVAAYMVVGIPLSLYQLHHAGSVGGLMEFYALGGLGLVLPGVLIVLRLGLGERTGVTTLVVDDDQEEGVLLAVIDAHRDLREFLVRPQTAGRCRAALGAPPPSERL
ncbi:hypothetical protein [Demequina sp.]|uniref:hypothetical protein n=1 Tax=Demequina sp. TaxID=2050685 RepID=UPI0026011D13|nr:hypothetical protein [Demequina sp.]